MQTMWVTQNNSEFLNINRTSAESFVVLNELGEANIVHRDEMKANVGLKGIFAWLPIPKVKVSVDLVPTEVGYRM